MTGMSTHPESPEAVLRILNAYVPPAGWNKRRQEAGATSKEGAMFAQTGDALRLEMEETNHGSQGRPATNAERRGTSHGSVL